MPPPGLAIALPLLPPLHDILFTAVAEVVNTIGWVIVADAVVVHPKLSVTVTVYVPADNVVPVGLEVDTVLVPLDQE